MPNVTLASADQLKAAEHAWAGLQRWQCEGVLIMTQWFAVTHQGSEAIKWAASARWSDLGAQLQSEIYRTLTDLCAHLRRTL